MSKFKITGGIPLHGEVTISGAKNATLPILAATLLADSPSTLHNVPNISDVHSFLALLEQLGAKTNFQTSENGIGGTVTVDPSELKNTPLSGEKVCHMRASILFLGPLLARFGEAKIDFPGGCVLGKRSVHAHVHALTSLGSQLTESTTQIHLTATSNADSPGHLTPAKIIMAEASVTATENAIMAAALTPGTTEIRWAAMEPHVQDLCNFISAMGVKIEGIGTHTLIVHGQPTGENHSSPLTGTTHTVTPDYLEAGTFALAAVLTNGEITINNCPTEQLDSFWQKLEEVGAKFTLHDNRAQIHKHSPEGESSDEKSHGLHAIEQLKTAVFPGFATDLQAPFTVLLTQCQGESRVHETLFEGRLNYLEELKKMGAASYLQNPQQATITGPSPLQGTTVKSCDIRAGAAVVLAALVAEGESTITDIVYTDRGYEKFEEKLRGLGAKIEREA
jgi:UDP-N-acetylglucosamine 1-carboxyvinyltransferase